MALPQFIGHRGYSARAPENTLSALHAAADAGIAWVELDVQCLGDGTPVIWHDTHVRRCSDGKGRLKELTLAEARQLDVGRWFDPRFEGERMATLKEALDVIAERGLGLNLEFKLDHRDEPSPLIDAVLPILNGGLPRERLLMSSFSNDVLDEIRQRDKKAPLGILFSEEIPRDWLWDAERLEPESIHVDWRYMNEARAREIIEGGMALVCYTVNDPDRFNDWWDIGVTSVISDDPLRFDRFTRALEN
ncbi:glycerophosphodiester phosphodiesterase family protein [Larsenimonas rhizosphaerae]|uniref:glycerophosphodiester phosphodiesterase family protein n=1 Tax=Larsenimonas rhizosphaerae TaxID=2944682 RepID=UPI002034050A|nr:glycerophosphodiester phosphodiesterase family protein [Larsenimonas rhizosphaerae]MCM2131138.1 glycerophosphoryl diester phosphodiesterase [Larsenimonas rhizosphaerae]